MTITASPGGVASSLSEAIFGARATGSASIATTEIIGAMLDSGTGISDPITTSTAYLYATNAGNLRVQLADVPDDQEEESLIIR